MDTGGPGMEIPFVLIPDQVQSSAKNQGQSEAQKPDFAGPGRQPGYFLFKAKKKVTKEMA
jgi:hypothetical protein